MVYHRLYNIANITVISNKNTVGVYDMESEVETSLKSKDQNVLKGSVWEKKNDEGITVMNFLTCSKSIKEMRRRHCGVKQARGVSTHFRR